MEVARFSFVVRILDFSRVARNSTVSRGISPFYSLFRRLLPFPYVRTCTCISVSSLPVGKEEEEEEEENGRIE